MPDFKLTMFSDYDPETQRQYFRFIEGDKLPDNAESLALFVHDHLKSCCVCGTDYHPAAIEEETGECPTCQTEAFEDSGLGLYGNGDTEMALLPEGWLSRL